MVKAFISGIDTPYGHNMALLLSRSFISTPKETDEPEEDVPDEEAVTPETPASVEKTPKEPYIIVGSFQKPKQIDTTSHQPYKELTKRGKFLETGDAKKDASRKEAIEKIPLPRVKQDFINEVVEGADREATMKLMLESDIIVCDMMQDVEETKWAVDSNPCLMQHLLVTLILLKSQKL
jgi:hypothetical protein